jgi:hypothetical protein
VEIISQKIPKILAIYNLNLVEAGVRAQFLTA